jgi:hypothetical protein
MFPQWGERKANGICGPMSVPSELLHAAAAMEQAHPGAATHVKSESLGRDKRGAL